MVPNRESALEVFYEWVKSNSLRKHCLTVEAAMRACARKHGEDEDTWGICGLLHDFDFERFPDSHPNGGARALKELGYPDEIIRSILGHSDKTDVPRDSLMARCLFAVDELCGFLLALAYVRPEHFRGMSAKSVERNLNKKGFAAKINREEIEIGIKELNTNRKEHIEMVIKALAEISSDLGF